MNNDIKQEEIEAEINSIFAKYEKMGIDKIISDTEVQKGTLSVFDKSHAEMIAKASYSNMITKSISHDLICKNMISIGNKYPFKKEFLEEVLPLFSKLAEVSVFNYRQMPDSKGKVWVQECYSETKIAIKAL